MFDFLNMMFLIDSIGTYYHNTEIYKIPESFFVPTIAVGITEANR